MPKNIKRKNKMENTKLEYYFGQQLAEYVGNDIEKARELVRAFRTIENSPEWAILKKIIQDTREKVIDNLKSAPLDQEVLISYKEQIAALDFLLNLPHELTKFLEIEIIRGEE